MNCDDRSCGCQPGCGCDGGCNGHSDCAGACARTASLGAPRPRPGLDALDVRIGDYGRFLAAATQALSSSTGPALQALATRDPSEPVMAMIDAWGIAADVLTFYRERLTNEGYLRCARDERSLRWLAGEVGYKPRPGVAATAWLAYLLDAHAGPVQIPMGAKAQTSPNGDEQMQNFETLQALSARYEWSAMLPRQTRMPAISLADALSRNSVKLAGTSTAVRPGEMLMFVFGYGAAQQVVREVATARIDVINGWVDVSLVPRLAPEQASELHKARIQLAKAGIGRTAENKTPSELQLFVLNSFFLGGIASDAFTLSNMLANSATGAVKDAIKQCVKTLRAISAPTARERIRTQVEGIDSALAAIAATQPASGRQPTLLALSGLVGSGAKRGALLKQTSQRLNDRLYQAWSSASAQATPAETAPAVFIMHTIASAYGSSAPKKEFKDPLVEWEIDALDKQGGAAYLDSIFANIEPGSLALVDVPLFALPVSAIPGERKFERVASARVTRLARIASTQTVGRSEYATNSRVTRLDLVNAEMPDAKRPFQVVDPTADGEHNHETAFGGIRKTVYTVQSEAVAVAAEPIENIDVVGKQIELDTLLDGIDVGRWIIVQGERTDIAIKRNESPDIVLPGIVDGELALVAGVDQQPYPDTPGDTLHTVLLLAEPLAYRYRRSTVKIYGNVVKASHGESVAETIGSGSAMARLQRFALRRAPLTFVPAVTTSGVQGTQRVSVNGVQWQEVESLLDAGATERVYEMATNETGAASFTFGDGIHGARLPSGQGNVRVGYRAGIGAVGNARVGQISLLATRPLGVNGVVNPLPATGGADHDRSERIRANTPLAALSLAPLSRLVSVADYAYFARRYAGVGQAVARKLADGAFECVHVTLAGVDDAPLRLDDALVSSLHAAYEAFGDPALPVVIGIRELMPLFVQARVAVLRDRDWDTVEASIRRCLLDTFSFDRRQLGQSAYLSEVICVIESVDGVEWVDVDLLGGISELALRSEDALALAVASLQSQISPGPVQSVVRVRHAVAAADDQNMRPGSADATRLLPAQLAFLLRDVPGTLVLNRA